VIEKGIFENGNISTGSAGSRIRSVVETEPNWQTSFFEWFREYRVEAFGTVLRFRPHRRLFLALLSPEDIGQKGWKISCPDKAYRIGVASEKTDEIRRARALGLASVRRGLHNAKAKESVAISIIPYASSADAQTRLPFVSNKMKYRHKRNHRHREQVALGHIEVTGVVDASALEHHCVTEKEPLYNQVITGTVDRYLFQILLGGFGDAPDWEFVSTLAAKQAAKIVDVLLPDVDRL
jgi:hypothetical protein